MSSLEGVCSGGFLGCCGVGCFLVGGSWNCQVIQNFVFIMKIFHPKNLHITVKKIFGEVKETEIVEGTLDAST
jgi:hypothetical protein